MISKRKADSITCRAGSEAVWSTSVFLRFIIYHQKHHLLTSKGPVSGQNDNDDNKHEVITRTGVILSAIPLICTGTEAASPQVSLLCSLRAMLRPRFGDVGLEVYGIRVSDLGGPGLHWIWRFLCLVFHVEKWFEAAPLLHLSSMRLPKTALAHPTTPEPQSWYNRCNIYIYIYIYMYMYVYIYIYMYIYIYVYI